MQSSSDFVSMLMMWWLPIVPYCVAWLAGIGLCVVRWRRHPIPSLLALIAFAIFLFSTVLATAVSAWLFQNAFGTGSFAQYEAWSRFVNYSRIGAGFLAWVLLLIALFGWRPLPELPVERESPDQPPDTAIRRWGD